MPSPLQRRGVRLLALAGLAAGLLAGCGSDDEPVSVAVSAPPLELLVREIGGNDVAIRPLTPAGAQPHDLPVTDQARGALRGANAVLYLSGGFQPQIQAELERLPRETARLDLLGDSPLPVAQPIDGINGTAEEAAQGAVDPHVWLDPVRYGELATRTARLLGELDEDHRDDYAARAKQLAAKSRQLDEEYRAALVGCQGRVLFTNHAAWGYLTERYGLKQEFVGGINPAARPSDSTLRAIDRVARDHKEDRAVLATSVPLPTRIASAITSNTAVEKIATLNPLEDLRGSRMAIDYVTVSRTNLVALVDALGCEAGPGHDAEATTPPSTP